MYVHKYFIHSGDGYERNYVGDFSEDEVGSGKSLINNRY